MATWETLKSYVLTNMEAEEKSPRLVAVTNTFPDGEVRVTLVSSSLDHHDNPWVSIDALVGVVSTGDALRAARSAGEKVCGGLATLPIGEQEFFVLRHAMPISQLGSENIDDFLVPFYSVTGGALGIAKELGDFNSL